MKEEISSSEIVRDSLDGDRTLSNEEKKSFTPNPDRKTPLASAHRDSWLR